MKSISTESVVLSVVCLADMLTTLFFVSTGAAVEVNPIMSACFKIGPAMFVFAKLLSFVPFVIITELHRRKNPAFCKTAARTAILVYLSAYVVLTVRTNTA
jgi:hypothetical protein